MQVVMQNNERRHKLYLSTLDIYFMPENLFYSVIDIIEKEADHLKLDEEGHHYLLFLIKENSETLKYFLCDPSYGAYDDCYTYITDTETEPYILDFKFQEDIEMDYVLKGTCSLEAYCKAIYYPFKAIIEKHGMQGFEELAMSKFPLEAFQEMERLLLKKEYIKI